MSGISQCPVCGDLYYGDDSPTLVYAACMSSDQERVTITLTREQAEAAKWALLYAGNSWRFSRRRPILTTIEAVDSAHTAIADQLRAQTPSPTEDTR